MQSRAMSLVETIVNIVIGFAVAVAAQLIVFPLFGIKASLAQNPGIGSVFTAERMIMRSLLGLTTAKN